jgi:serine/threonine protein kinase
MNCLDDNTLYEYLQGRLPQLAYQAVVEHADSCIDCRQLISYSAHDFYRDQSSEPRVMNLPSDPSVLMEPYVSRAPDPGPRYAIVREHARGGLGRVLEGWDVQLGRPVAIKELLDRRDPIAQERFQREARITARLQHPGIVPVHEVGRGENGRPFFAMKLVRGQTLQQLVHRSRSLEERLALLPNLIAVADAIAYAHTQRIIHRDIKPANILIGPFGETVVIDWGLAKDLGSLEAEPVPVEPKVIAVDTTIPGTVLGTPGYMAPEQAEGAPVDERADVYALGSVLYTLLAGEPPYKGADSTEVLEKLRVGPPPPIAERQFGLPRHLTAIVDKAMARDPAARYRNALDLADDLKSFQTSQLVLDPDTRRAAHERLERVLEASPQPRASSLVKETDALAFDRAAQLYRMFLELRRDLKTKLGEALEGAGRAAEAAEVYLAASIGAGPMEALELQRRAAHQLLRSGRVDEGLVALRAVLATMRIRLPAGWWRSLFGFVVGRVRLALRGIRFRERDESQVAADALVKIDTCWTVSMGLAIIDPVRGASFQTRLLQLALDAGEPKRIARSLALDAAYLAAGGSATRRACARRLHAARRVAERVNDPLAAGLIRWAEGTVAFLQGRWRRARTLCSEAEEAFERHANTEWELDTAQYFNLCSSYYLGDFGDLAIRVPRLVADAQAKGNRYAETNLATTLSTVLRLAEGDPESCRAIVARARAMWSKQGFHIQHYTALMAEINADLYRGRGIAALEQLDASWAALARSPVIRVQQSRVRAVHLRGASAVVAATESKERAPLLARAAADARRLERERVPWANALALLLRGAIAVAGADPRAAELLDHAAEECDRCELSFYAAAGRRALGRLQGGEAGALLVAGADQWMTTQQIREPERFTTALTGL